MKLSGLPQTKYADLFVVDRKMAVEFNPHVQMICDELELDYDVLEPAGWTFRRLPDGRFWAEHPAGGNSEWWNGRWRWHGDSTSFIGSGL